MATQIAIIIFILLSLVLIVFQLCLALGAPWGLYAMGGYFPGKYPLKMRIASLVQTVIYILFSILVLTKAGIILPELYSLSKVAIWFIFVLLALGVVMNLISKSVWERRIWSPVAMVMAVSTLVIALS